MVGDAFRKPTLVLQGVLDPLNDAGEDKFEGGVHVRVCLGGGVRMGWWGKGAACYRACWIP